MWRDDHKTAVLDREGKPPMTNISITPSADGVKIQLIGVGADRTSLLETFNGCADGSCACSTDEYEKVESMQVQGDGDAITIDVRTKQGETIDPSCISECMDYAQETAAAKNSCC